MSRENAGKSLFPQELTPQQKDYLLLFYLSFRYSQGSEILQRKMYNYFRAHYELSIPAGLVFNPSHMPDPYKHKYLDSSQPIPVKDKYTPSWGAIHRGIDEPTSLFNIVWHIIKRDLKFITERGRPTSYYLDYISRKQKTGHEKFDELFREIRDKYKWCLLPIHFYLQIKIIRNSKK